MQLVDTESGNNLWAERMDFPAEDLFTVQDEVVHRIVGTLVGRVDAARVQVTRRKPPANLAAYECVLLGRSLPIGDTVGEAKRLYEKAIALDPGYSRGYTELSYALSLEWLADLSSGPELLDRAFDLAKQAVSIDGNDPDNLNGLGWVYLIRRAYSQAEYYFRKAYDLNPQDPWHNAYMAVLKAFLGDGNAALEWLARAQTLDPYFEPSWLCHIAGISHFVAGRYDLAISELERSMTIPFWVLAYLAAANALASREIEAREWSHKLLSVKPDFRIDAFLSKDPLKRQEDLIRLAEGLRSAGVPE
jgi:tetratricopeptide (TPR) repeat protein